MVLQALTQQAVMQHTAAQRYMANAILQGKMLGQTGKTLRQRIVKGPGLLRGGRLPGQPALPERGKIKLLVCQ
ncbi:hypothetical protein D3C75_1061510 [compost metagenome]